MLLDQGLRSTFNNDWNFLLPLTDLIPCPWTLLKQAVPVAVLLLTPGHGFLIKKDIHLETMGY
jgi:hypothetical protein